MSARFEASRARRLSDAELLSARHILPGQWLQTWRSPALAAAMQAGQYVQVRAPDGWGAPLRRPVTVHGIDRSRGELELHVATGDPGAAWLSTLRAGEVVPLFGPFGQPIRIDRRSQSLLLVGDGPFVAALRPLVDEALATGRRVTLLMGADRAADVYPSSLLPDEVEYVVATRDGSLGESGTVLDMITRYESWADQAIAAGPAESLGGLVRLVAGREKRLGVARLGGGQRGWLQVLLPQSVGCALGVCLGCVVDGARGPVRVCRDGPTFESTALAWPDAP